MSMKLSNKLPRHKITAVFSFEIIGLMSTNRVKSSDNYKEYLRFEQQFTNGESAVPAILLLIGGGKVPAGETDRHKDWESLPWEAKSP